jgi:hypothetical protein
MAPRWLRLALVGAGTALAAGPAGALGASTTTTSTTAPPVATPITAAALPCSAPSGGAPCTVDPTRLQITYDRGKDPALTGVKVAWIAAPGRPQSAPAPQPSTSVTLPLSSGSCTSKGTVATCTWAWPLTYPTKTKAWVLNGTYRVTPTSKVYSSTDLGVAVPPAPPVSPHGGSSAYGTVSLFWGAGASPEPDLVGYQVSRNNQVVYTCSTDGAGPGAGTPCHSPLSFNDQPAAGTWTYHIVALRFGAGSQAGGVVASPPASVTIPAGTGNGGGGSLYLPSVPIVAYPPGVLPVAAPPPPSPAGQATTTTTAGPAGSQTLPYVSVPAQAQGQDPAALGSDAKETGPKKSNLDSVAAVALGLIALALAAHVWYLRGEMRLFAARSELGPPRRRRPL